MLWFGHAAAGYLIAELILAIVQPAIAPPHLQQLLLIGAIAGILPDMDFLAFFAKHHSLKLQSNDSHKHYMTHTPFFWLLAGILIALSFTTTLGILAGLIVALGGISHIVLDAVQYSAMLFWPFSTKYYGLHAMPLEAPRKKESTAQHYTRLARIYSKNWTFYLELALVIAALMVAFAS